MTRRTATLGGMPGLRPRLFALIRVLRPHQWSKNLLVLLAAFAAHRLLEPEVWKLLLPLFAATCLLSSAIYVLNDALDVESDRKHPDKCRRPFASGELPRSTAPWLFLALLAGATLLALPLPLPAQTALLGYGLIALAYCLWLKRLLWLDVLTLAGLYVLRVVVGAEAIDVPLSPWLAGFALFLFMALAALKRYAELVVAPNDWLPGRGYRREDALPVLAFGSACAVAALLVLTLYMNSPEVLALYSRPEWLWTLVPCLLYWQARLWTLAHRAELHHDPVLFALRDPISLLLGLVCLGSVLRAI